MKPHTEVVIHLLFLILIIERDYETLQKRLKQLSTTASTSGSILFDICKGLCCYQRGLSVYFSSVLVTTYYI